MAASKVLVVEDEILVLITAADVLKDKGLSVIEAATADDGVALLEQAADEVSVIFSDIDTPGQLDGLALAAIAKERWPDKPVVLTSGRVFPSAEALPPGTIFVPKPYDLNAISELLVELAGSVTAPSSAKIDPA